MKSHNIMKYFTLCLSLFIIFLLYQCNKMMDSPINNPKESKDKTELKKSVREFKLMMPDSIPRSVDKSALDIAFDKKFENIRILKVGNIKKDIYHIWYFDNYGQHIESYVVEYNNETKSTSNLKLIDKPQQYVLSDSLKIPKQLEKPNSRMCFYLATIYDYGAYTGESFQFSQSRVSVGWFHKVVFYLNQELGCCGWDYQGNFDNRIGSHAWWDYSVGDYFSRPETFDIYKGYNRNGDCFRFHGHWYEEFNLYGTQYPYWGRLPGGFCNNVSSFDMKYQVIYY